MLSHVTVTDQWPRLSRDAAAAFELPRYFDGPVCKNGHQAGRYVSGNSCRACRAAKNLTADQRAALYAARKTADITAYQRDWYAANADDQRAKARARRVAKPDIYRAHGSNRRARNRNAEGFHTAADLAVIRTAQADKCAYCRVALKRRGHLDHIKPLARGGSNWPGNLQLLCQPCNQSKNDRDPVEFARSRGMLI